MPDPLQMVRITIKRKTIHRDSSATWRSESAGARKIDGTNGRGRISKWIQDVWFGCPVVALAAAMRRLLVRSSTEATITLATMLLTMAALSCGAATRAAVGEVRGLTGLRLFLNEDYGTFRTRSGRGHSRFEWQPRGGLSSILLRKLPLLRRR